MGSELEAALEELRLLRELADTLPPEELNAEGYRLWERFAPMVRDGSGHEPRGAVRERRRRPAGLRGRAA